MARGSDVQGGTFAELFTEAIAGRGQREVAAILGTSQTHVSRMMRGERVPEDFLIPPLAEFMSMTEDELVRLVYAERLQLGDKRRNAAEVQRLMRATIKDLERSVRALVQSQRRLEARCKALEARLDAEHSGPQASRT